MNARVREVLLQAWDMARCGREERGEGERRVHCEAVGGGQQEILGVLLMPVVCGALEVG